MMLSNLVQTASVLLGTAVLQSLISMTLIWAVVQVILLFIPHRQPSMRYSVMMLGLCGLTIPPLVIVSQPAARQSAARQFNATSFIDTPIQTTSANLVSQSQIANTVEASSATVEVANANSSSRDPVQTPIPSPSRWFEQTRLVVVNLMPKREWIGCLWVLGFAVASSRILLSANAIRRWSRKASGCDKDLERMLGQVQTKMDFLKPVRLLVSNDRIVPMACGFLKPVIILPASLLTGLSTSELEAIIKHEVAHLIRNDLWHNAFQLLIEALFFYHPCVWLLSHQIRRQREICCDALAAPSPTDRVSLGNALLKLEIHYSKHSQRTLLSAAANGGDTMMRVRFLCNKPQARTSASSSAAVCLLLAVTLTCLTLISFPNKSIAKTQEPTQVVEVTQKQGAKELFGKVVDDSGKPLEGASVFWADFSGDEISTTSEADGQFRLQLPDQPYDGNHFLWVYSPGYNAKAVQPFSGRDKLRSDCIVALGKSQQVEIQVLNVDGSPCSGAKITPSYHEAPNGVFYSDKSTGLTDIVPPGVAKLLSVTTDVSGKAILRGLKKDFLESVNVQAGDLAVQDFRGGFNYERRTIKLRPVATIRGRIDADDLSPLAERELRIRTKCGTPGPDPGDPFRDANGPTSTVVCKVASDGSFEAKNIGAGSGEIFFRWDANCPKQLKVPDLKNILPGELREVTISAVDAVKIKGKLITDDTREPVARCQLSVRFDFRSSRNAHTLVSDEQGEFEAYVLPGEVEVQAFNAMESNLNAYGYPRNSRITVSPESEQIDLPAMEFYKQLEARVLVVDSNDKPIPDKFVVRLGEAYGRFDAYGITDDQGIATVIFSKGSGHDSFSGDWIIASSLYEAVETHFKKLPRLKLKQESPPILMLVK